MVLYSASHLYSFVHKKLKYCALVLLCAFVMRNPMYDCAKYYVQLCKIPCTIVHLKYLLILELILRKLAGFELWFCCRIQQFL